MPDQPKRIHHQYRWYHGELNPHSHGHLLGVFDACLHSSFRRDLSGRDKHGQLHRDGREPKFLVL